MLQVMVALLIHEAWVTFQHANVLFNPFCQQLDRRYGVALLRKGQHWVIASVLVMYWSREVASMLLCLPYISQPAQVAVFVSVAYHTIKMLSICKDAQRLSAQFLVDTVFLLISLPSLPSLPLPSPPRRHFPNLKPLVLNHAQFLNVICLFLSFSFSHSRTTWDFM